MNISDWIRHRRLRGRSDHAWNQGTADHRLMRLGDLTRSWHAFRVVVATSAAAFGLPLGLAWRWPGGFLVAAIAIVALGDALRRHKTPIGSPVRTMLLDAGLIGVAMVVVGLEPAGVWAPLLYMLAIPMLLLPWPRAVPVIVYSAGWAAAAFVGTDVMQPGRIVNEGMITAIVTAIFGGATLALLAVVARELDRSYRERESRLEYERALAKCGEVLLARTDERAVDVALEALLQAVPAQNIFVDKNFEDPDLGLCARVTHEVIRPGCEELVDEEIWVEPEAPETVSRTVLPYSEMPTSYAALAAGRPAVVIRSQLTGRERQIYEEDGCLSELNIPIVAGGDWIGSIGLADYVTERDWSDADQQILQTAAAMIGAFWERNAAYLRLEELIRSKDEFLASISHEIRTPLTAVLGFSAILHQEATDLPADAAGQVALIAEQAQEVADIVEDLLVAARADIDSLDVASDLVDLRDETDKVLAARAIQDDRAVTISGEPTIARADRSRVRQIVRCLLSNAMRYGGDRVEVQIGRLDDLATLAVVDDGDGIPQEQEDQIFDAFHRAHSRAGRPQAIGLGLYVARHLARLMGGDLTYRRYHGRTAFELELPLAVSPVG